MRETREYGEDTSLTVDYPWGLYRSGRAICSDGKVRTLKRISSTADTWFSIPASVRVNGRTVSGYITVECASGSSVATPDDMPVVKFCRFSYGKNANLLPVGAWRNI